MTKKMIGPFAGLAIFVFIVVAYSACKYNTLVNAEEEVDGAWAQVENVLKRRADLIPNLVNTVKGFAEQEQSVFGNVAAARQGLLNAQGPAEAAQANQQLTSALGRLLMISERYPELKSNQNFLSLQAELAGTENRIAVERKRYNEKVTAYNKMIRRFPSSLFAGLFDFERKQYFEVEESDKAVPDVEF